MPAYPSGATDEISAALGSMPGRSTVSEVATRLLDTVTSGSIAPGTRLPSERTLAANLGVGRSAVREALATLDILGVVDVRPGSGTYLRGTASELLPQTLGWATMLGRESTSELLEVRNDLEQSAARRAAIRMPDDALHRLDDHIAAMRTGLGDLSTFVEADVRFHQEVAAGAGNMVLADLLSILRSLLRIWSDRAVQNTEDARLALSEHERIAAALRDRDPDAAASQMAAHMATASTRLNHAASSPDVRES